MESKSNIIAFFDFDGTITTKDSLSEFFKFIEPSARKHFFLKYGKTLPHLLLYKLGILSLDKLKKARIRAFFKRENELNKKAESFAETILPTLIKTSALERINWHLKSNHEVFIVSASIDLILQPWCKSRNLKLITNVMEASVHSYLANDCNGEEKVNRIRKEVNLDKYTEIYAYGDTEGDRPMLMLAHKPHFCVFE